MLYIVYYIFQAALYQTDFRPVPLEEYIKVGNSILNRKMEIVRTFTKTSDLGGRDPDHIVELCNEVNYLLFPCSFFLIFVSLLIVFSVYILNY